MLVKDIMTRHPILVSPETHASAAQKIMMENKIRHLPVVGDGKRLIGLITRSRLALKPDIVSSLNFWEISRYLATLSVEKVMLKGEHVYTIKPEQTVERAAALMSQHKIGGLPVIEEDLVVGILSEVDLLDAFQKMLGLPVDGVRVTVRMPNVPGEFNKLTTAVSTAGWGVMGIGSFPSPRKPGFWDVVVKIPAVTTDQVERVISEIADQEIVDIREAA